MMFHSIHSEQGIALKGRALRGAFWLGIVLLFGMMGSARADQPGPELVLSTEDQDLKVGPGMNASGRDLAGCRFVVQDLRGANFDNANLDGAVLWDCKLQGASFRGAFLTGLTTEDCEFADADFTDATINGVLGVNRSPFDPELGHRLSEAQFKSTWSYKSRNLNRCSINASRKAVDPLGRITSMPFEYDFRNADLRGAWLTGDFSACDFANAQIDGIRCGMFFTCSFEAISQAWDFQQRPVKLTGVHILGGMVGAWDLSGSVLERTVIYAGQQVNLTGARLVHCQLNGASKAILQSTQNYRERDFVRSGFWHCDFNACSFRGFDLTGVWFVRCDLTDADFTNAVIDGAHFSVQQPDVLAEQLKRTKTYQDGQMQSFELKGIRMPGEWNWETGRLEYRKSNGELVAP